MVSSADLLESIQKSSAGIGVAELLVRHPHRSARLQRLIDVCKDVTAVGG
jgi:hypothetical protein